MSLRGAIVYGWGGDWERSGIKGRKGGRSRYGRRVLIASPGKVYGPCADMVV